MPPAPPAPPAAPAPPPTASLVAKTAQNEFVNALEKDLSTPPGSPKPTVAEAERMIDLIDLDSEPPKSEPIENEVKAPPPPTATTVAAS
eukprot:gene214-1046_t